MGHEIKKMDVVAERHVIDFNTFGSTAATSQTVNIYIRGNITYLLGAFAYVNTAFAGVTRPEVKIGYTNLTEAIIPLQHLNKVGQLKTGRMHQIFCEGMAVPTGKNQSVILTIQSASGNLSDLTAGELEVVVVYAARPVRG